MLKTDPDIIAWLYNNIHNNDINLTNNHLDLQKVSGLLFIVYVAETTALFWTIVALEERNKTFRYYRQTYKSTDITKWLTHL